MKVVESKIIKSSRGWNYRELNFVLEEEYIQMNFLKGMGVIMESNDIKNKVIELSKDIVVEESEKNGQVYTKSLSKALDRACRELKVDEKEFIKMFI